MTLGVEDIFPMIDRAVQPLAERMGRMEQKLDNALKANELLAVHEDKHNRHEARLKEVEEGLGEARLSQAKSEGSSKIIIWLLTVVGAPIVVGLALAGVAKLFGVHV